MELKDLFLTPIYLIIIYAIAYGVRSRFTNRYTKKYFIPALTLKLVGAIGLGLVYQFYYNGGDTFNYFWESKIIYEAFKESPAIGLKLLLANGNYSPDIYNYAVKMHWFASESNYFVIKTAAFYSLFCFGTYTVIALFFAVFSFIGIHALYSTLIKISPLHYKQFAVAVFFVPSLFFWGSGVGKDSICVGALGLAFWGFYQIFVEKRKILVAAIYLVLAILTIKFVKTYILLCFIPAAVLWVFMANSSKIKSKALRYISKPILIGAGLVAGYFGSIQLTADDEKYSIENVTTTAEITSNYLGRRTIQAAGTGRRTGSEYNVGKLDGSLGSMITAAPQAILVSLYRPFLFEVRNPVMLLSALECTWFLWLTFGSIKRLGLIKFFKAILGNPFLTFCIIFSILFGLGVGLTSGNFGTLVRYKVPLLPFFVSALLVLKDYKGHSRIVNRKNSAKIRPNLNPV